MSLLACWFPTTTILCSFPPIAKKEFEETLQSAEKSPALEGASERRDGGGNRWIAGSPIDPALGQEPHASAIRSRQYSEAVVLDLVQPPGPSGQGARVVTKTWTE